MLRHPVRKLILLCLLVAIIFVGIKAYRQFGKKPADSPSANQTISHTIKENVVNKVVEPVLKQQGVDSFWDIAPTGSDQTLGDIYKTLDDEDKSKVDDMIDEYISTDTAKNIAGQLLSGDMSANDLVKYVQEEVVKEEDKKFVEELIGKYSGSVPPLDSVTGLDGMSIEDISKLAE